MNLLAKAVELKAAQDAAKPVEKLSILARIKAYFRKRQGKKAYEALKVAKREEKAAQQKTLSEQADALDAESDRLVHSTIGMKDKDAVNAIMDEAIAKAQEAAALRCKI